MFYNEFLNRFSMMLTETQQEKLKSASVLVFGVGGVGSAVANMLVRSGITHIGVVDFDNIDITNINRQMVANSTNIGKLKVDEMEVQLKIQQLIAQSVDMEISIVKLGLILKIIQIKQNLEFQN